MAGNADKGSWGAANPLGVAQAVDCLRTDPNLLSEPDPLLRFQQLAGVRAGAGRIARALWDQPVPLRQARCLSLPLHERALLRPGGIRTAVHFQLQNDGHFSALPQIYYRSGTAV